MADEQRIPVYQWEDSFRTFVENNAPRLRLRRLIRKAERLYRVPQTKISFHPRRHRSKALAKIESEYCPDRHQIWLGWKDHNYAIALHETAHAITDHLFGHDLPGHGYHWLGVYMYLLEWAKVAPRSALHASAREAGLRWAPDGMVGPDVIRQNYASRIERAAEVRGT